MKYVIDCSVAFKWEVPEPLADKALRLRDAFRLAVHELLAPDLFPTEVSNALLVAERRGRILPGQSALLLADVLTTCPAVHPSLPRLLPRAHILATSLTSKQMFAFDREGLIRNDESVLPGQPQVRLISGDLPLSLLVAASSAFPPFFPPVRVDQGVLRCSASQFGTVHRLTDGGIYDNLGLERMLLVGTGAFDLVVESDAESTLVLDKATFGSTMGRNFRATYILMERVGRDVRARARAALPLALCELSKDNVGRCADVMITVAVIDDHDKPISDATVRIYPDQNGLLAPEPGQEPNGTYVFRISKYYAGSVDQFTVYPGEPFTFRGTVGVNF